MAPAAGLEWSAQFSYAPSHRSTRLPGDKIVLPPSALEQLLSNAASVSAAPSGTDSRPAWDPWNPRANAAYQQELDERQQRLPQPLTFRLVNPTNGRVAFAGIQEFSAEDTTIEVGPYLRGILGLMDEDSSLNSGDHEQPHTQQVTVHFQQLDKGTYVKLRPLEAGYDAEDWKALLERYMRTRFTTLTKGEVLEVPKEAGARSTDSVFRFLIDHFTPDQEAVCVVDTDLEVDIEALNEEQARETVKSIAAKHGQTRSGTSESTAGGDLDMFKARSGQVLPGQYVDYQLPSWPRSQTIEVVLTWNSEEEDLDLLISPLSATQRSRPRLDSYVFADWEDRPSKRIRLQPTNVELDAAEALYISVHAYEGSEAEGSQSVSRKFTIQARVVTDLPEVDIGDQHKTPRGEGDVQCKNCDQWVPGRTLMLHENFCLRNNMKCPQGCGIVFQKRSEEFARHWHCPHDTFYGSRPETHTKHDALYHPQSPLHCSRCDTSQTFSSIPLLAQHHVTTCPGKIILCRFCHLAVPQEGDADEPNHEALLSGLTVHELADGSRTTECHLCGRITRMRDMETHLKHHNLERKSRARPRVCRNQLCGNTLDGAGKNGSTRLGKDPGNDIGVCDSCFSPLYVTLHDPDNKALKRRIERRYLQQLMTGCGKSWCQNEFCRTGRKNTGRPEDGTSAKTAIALAKPFVDGSIAGHETPLHFCVDEAVQRRRERALMLEAEMVARPDKGTYDFPWCLAALEAEGGDLDKGRMWLENYAPRIDEERL